MRKIDRTVLLETAYITAFTVILSLVLQAVFLILNKWNYTVLLGNLLGAAAAVGNFFLMGLTVQSAVIKEEKAAKNTIKVSQGLRLLFLFIVAAIGYLGSVFNTLSVIIPYLFPRIAVFFRPFFNKK